MASPAALAQSAPPLSEQIPEYNWNDQSRGLTIVGSYTSGSIQTYNQKGQPADSKADQDD